MGGLQLLSALNWCFALLYGALIFVPIFFPVPLPAALAIAGGVVLIAGPHAYLGYVIDKGRGRTLQTIFAVLNLGNFPVGTIFGAFALYTVWGEGNRELFENPPDDDSGPKPPPPEFSDEADALEMEEGETARAFSLRLREAGAPVGQLRARLEEQGLDFEAIDIVLSSLDRKAAPRHAGAAPPRVRQPPDRPVVRKAPTRR
jgi:hypothetical protein